MRWARALQVLVLVAVLVGCEAAGELLPTSPIECGGTEATLCHEVARLAVSRMNLDATGPVTRVTLIEFSDCDRVGQANFLGAEMRTATNCWEVAVTGERSHGGGFVWRNLDGTLEASW